MTREEFETRLLLLGFTQVDVGNFFDGTVVWVHESTASRRVHIFRNGTVKDRLFGHGVEYPTRDYEEVLRNITSALPWVEARP